MGAPQMCETADTEDLTVYPVLSFNRCVIHSSTTRTIMKIFDYMVFCKDPTYTRYEFFKNFPQAQNQYKHWLSEFGDLPNHDVGLCVITRIV